jgi:hypothetical protein
MKPIRLLHSPLRLLAVGMFIALAPFGVGAEAERPLDVLFVGNSYTYVNDLPGTFSRVAAWAGHPAPVVTMHAPGGQTLEGHSRDTALPAKLRARHDIVILQEHSLRPAFAEVNLDVRRLFLESCRHLVAEIRGAHPETRILLYETWARHPSAWQQKPPVEFVGANPEEMQARLHRWYNEAARQMSLEVVPAGDLWAANFRAPHPLPLHQADASHPAPAGTYLAALAFLAVVYGEPPVTTYQGGLPPADAERLQALARGHFPHLSERKFPATHPTPTR